MSVLLTHGMGSTIFPGRLPILKHDRSFPIQTFQFGNASLVLSVFIAPQKEVPYAAALIPITAQSGELVKPCVIVSKLHPETALTSRLEVDLQAAKLIPLSALTGNLKKDP